MNFKRPSFRRGGSTGIGQLTPRIKAKMGFPNFGVGQGDNTGYQKYMEKVRADRASGQPSGLAQLVLGPRYTDPNFVSPFLKPDSSFFSNRTGFEFMNLGAQRDGNKITRTADTPSADVNVYDDDMEGMFSGVTEGRFVTMDDGRITDTKTGETVTEDQISIILENEKPTEKIDLNSEGTGELSMKDAITGEVDILKELLKDTGMSKGEKALLAAKAIRTPGTLADKLEAGGDLALKEIKEQKKQEKAIILTAYKNYKAKDLAGDKMNREETLVKNLVNRQLKDPKNTKSKSQLELEAWKSLAPGNKDKDVNKEFALLKLADRGFQVQIQDAQSDIKNYSSKNTAAAKLKVAEAQRILDLAAQYAAAAGLEIPVYAEGGRVQRAVGSPIMGETITETVVEKTPDATMEATEVVAADNIEPMAPVTKMDFADLRNRLPQEITDDIVQLLANSEEALQAFAYIKTQEDINAFNIKYGVNLILPAETV
jgi:hypothetical protein